MKLTRKAFMEKGAEVSAKRAMDFENMVKEKGASDSAMMFPTLMVLMSGLTMNRLADNLGLTKVFDNGKCKNSVIMLTIGYKIPL